MAAFVDVAFLLLSVVFFLSLFPDGSALASAAASPSSSIHAYVTVALTDFETDEELLAIRVLLRSLTPLDHPFIILVSSAFQNPSIQNLLESEGATFTSVSDLKGVPHEQQAQFRFFHAWSLNYYERVIFMDPFNVVVHKDKLDTLFKCGHFCALYLTTPCLPNTGLLALKPDQDEYNALLASIRDHLPRTPSYFDGPKYVLSKHFHSCGSVPVFSPNTDIPSESCMNRLLLGYNIPGFYFIEKRSWDLFRCGDFKSLEDPAATTYYGPPLYPAMQPWFWWTTAIEPAWTWIKARNHLNEDGVLSYVLLSLFLALFIGWAGIYVLRLVAGKPFLLFPIPVSVVKMSELCGPYLAALGASFIFSFLNGYLAVHSFSPVVLPQYGWLLFILYYHVYLYLIVRILAVLCAARGLSLTFTLGDLRLSVLAFTYIAISPFLDEAVDRLPGVNWNIAYKILNFLPALAALSAAQYWFWLSLMLQLPVFRSPLDSSLIR